jgi:ribosome-interacting GTPase 1
MPANLTPEYKEAEAAYRRASDNKERLECLRAMLRCIPKHKGTDHLQADIKTKIKEITEELAAPKKAGARRAPPTFIRPEGAAQVVMLGPPNSGKSALHGRLTGSRAQEGPYPFTTQYPQPGMLPVDDVAIQLVDLPSISKERPVPWIANTLSAADACLLVVDLGEAGCVEQVLAGRDLLAERKVRLTEEWDAPERDEDDPFGVLLPTLLVVSKVDRLDAFDEEVAAFRDLTGFRFPAIGTSAVGGTGLTEIGPWLFEHIGIVRVYTRAPRSKADLGRPYTVRRGQTVLDVARLVHREVAASLRFARIWGGAGYDGQQVGRDHEVSDGDIIEIHS